MGGLLEGTLHEALCQRPFSGARQPTPALRLGFRAGAFRNTLVRELGSAQESFRPSEKSPGFRKSKRPSWPW